jgi:hypothetical protein
MNAAEAILAINQRFGASYRIVGRYGKTNFPMTPIIRRR